MKMTHIILASTSPRRRELLRQIGLKFDVLPSNAPEDYEPGMAPIDVVRMLAERKAADIAKANPDSFVIAADTVVTADGEILGKPGTAERAVQMLQKLNGRAHQVMTGLALQCVNKGIRETLDVTTYVTFGELSKSIIEQYVATGEPLDKAGAYGVQGIGAVLVKSISGSYYNVVGLPLFEIASAIERHLGAEYLINGNQ